VNREDYRPIVSAIASRFGQGSRCLTVGVAGAQGTGKSTLAAHVCEQLEARHGLRAVVVSLDDYYLTKASRQELARTVHPLLATRGVPGTHDVGALYAALRRLSDAAAGEAVELLQFSKADDDRVPETRSVEGPFDVILFEGWCVGASPQPDAELANPINALEQAEDADGRWRKFANDQLAHSYASLWTELGFFVFLAAPDFATVYQFRDEAEQKLRAARGLRAPGVMTAEQLQRFVQHYERITRHMLRTTPAVADLVLQLDAKRRVTALVTT
jgi:D-glycerate 3-kinase